MYLVQGLLKNIQSHTLMNNQTAVLSVMYLTAIGSVLVATGIIINVSVFDIDVQVLEVADYFRVLFAGGFVTTFFWV